LCVQAADDDLLDTLHHEANQLDPKTIPFSAQERLKTHSY